MAFQVTFRVTNKHYLIGCGVLIVYAIFIRTLILLSININAFYHLHVQKFHLHLNVFLDGEVACVQLLQSPLIFLDRLIEFGLSHFLENSGVVLSECPYELTISIEEHGVLLVVIIEQGSL